MHRMRTQKSQRQQEVAAETKAHSCIHADGRTSLHSPLFCDEAQCGTSCSRPMASAVMSMRNFIDFYCTFCYFRPASCLFGLFYSMGNSRVVMARPYHKLVVTKCE